MIIDKNYIKVTEDEREGENYCSECDSWFDEPEFNVFYQHHEYFGAPCEERMADNYRCPYCGNEDYYRDENILTYYDDDEDYEEVKKGGSKKWK